MNTNISTNFSKEKEKLLAKAMTNYAEYLKSKKMFFTKERVALLHAIFEQPDHFSADELLFEIQKSNRKVSRATLYRSLSQMVEVGILSESDFGHGHTHYEVLMGARPHAHLILSDTGEVREIHSKRLEQVLDELAEREGVIIKQCKIQVFATTRH